MTIALKKILEPGDVLIVIPPFVDPGTPSLGGHLLQASCLRVDVTVRVFYSDLIFATLMGSKFYETIMNVNQATFIGERLFTASAFGLPVMGRNLDRFFDPAYIPDHLWQKNRDFVIRQMPELFDPVRKWVSSIDWKEKEEQAARWIDAMAGQIVQMGYPMVGCSTTQGGLAPAVALLNRVKEKKPDIVTVLGGALCEGEMAEGIVSMKTGVDYIFSGEGEITFPAFARAALAGDLPGEKIIYGEPVENLDDLPVPDYREYVEQRDYISSKYPLTKKDFPLPYESSRGCQWGRCNFCGLNGKRDIYRAKSADKVIADLALLTERFGRNKIQMTDNIMPLQYFKTLLPRLAEELPSLDILYEVKANMKLERVSALKKAGVNEIQPGIEALSDSLLNRIGKGVTVKEIIALLRYGRSVDIKMYWNLLFGFPGDHTADYEEMLRLVPLLRHLPPPERFTTMKIFRFSRYQTEPEAFGISRLRPAGMNEDIYPSEADLDKLAYYFIGDYDAQSYESPGIIAALHREYRNWRSDWDLYKSLPFDTLLPTLHLERGASGEYILYDTRGLNGTRERMTVSREQASVLLTARPLDAVEEYSWAVEAKLGVMAGDWYIPLATAEPDLLLEFEKEYKREV